MNIYIDDVVSNVYRFNVHLIKILFCFLKYGQSQTRSGLHNKCSRGSHSSDTSSAYSGSDTMASNHSELDGDEPDLSGLKESMVDSDEDEDLAESMDVSCISYTFIK